MGLQLSPRPAGAGSAVDKEVSQSGRASRAAEKIVHVTWRCQPQREADIA